MDHPVIGPARFEGIPFQFSDTGPDNWRSAPLLGEDNDYVFKDIVGLDDDEYDRAAGRRGDLMGPATSRVARRPAGGRAGRRPGRRDARQAARRDGRRRGQGRAAGGIADAGAIGPFADDRRRRRPQPDLLVLQHQQAQRRGRLPHDRRPRRLLGLPGRAPTSASSTLRAAASCGARARPRRAAARPTRADRRVDHAVRPRPGPWADSPQLRPRRRWRSAARSTAAATTTTRSRRSARAATRPTSRRPASPSWA